MKLAIADPANDVAAEKSGSERDPESKQFRDCRNVSVGIMQAFEQRQGHGVRDIAGHSKASDHEEDWKGPWPEPRHHFLDRRE